MSGAPLILRLPLELRQQIYAQLIPAEPVSHPVPRVAITSVSSHAPNLALLTIHPKLTADVLDYFFHQATWKLIFSHAFNFFRVDSDLSNLASWSYLPRIQKVEVVFFCDILLVKEYPSFGVERFCAEIKRRAARACEVLASAHDLKHVTVSWVDTTQTGAWERKALVLEPLQALRDRVSFSVGEITGPEGSEATLFLKAVTEQLGIASHTPP